METIVLILTGLAAVVAIAVYILNKSRCEDCDDCSRKGTCPSVAHESSNSVSDIENKPKNSLE